MLWGGSRGLYVWVPAVTPQIVNTASARRFVGVVMGTSDEPANPDWAAFYGQLQRFVAARVRAAADADDLVQLILERALSKRPQHGEIDSVAAWLFTIARNAVLDHQRAEQRSRASLLRDEPAGIAEPSGAVGAQDRDEVLACVKPLLDILPEDARQLLQWADVEERPLQSIADMLGISLTATKSRVQRARKTFVGLTQRCCTVTLDARGRVSELLPRRDGCNPCDPTLPTSRTRKR